VIVRFSYIYVVLCSQKTWTGFEGVLSNVYKLISGKLYSWDRIGLERLIINRIIFHTEADAGILCCMRRKFRQTSCCSRDSVNHILNKKKKQESIDTKIKCLEII
jgi:hypothetical protein